MNKIFAIFLILVFFASCGKDVDLSNSQLKPVDTLTAFDKEINKGVSMVFFHATWCSICKAQRPAVEDVAKNEKLKFVNFLQVDTDHNRDITQKYSVPGQPVILFMKDGQEKHRLAGSGHAQQKIADILLSL